MLSDYPTMDLEPENDNQLFFILKESQTITKALSQLVKKKVRHHIKK